MQKNQTGQNEVSQQCIFDIRNFDFKVKIANRFRAVFAIQLKIYVICNSPNKQVKIKTKTL
jgi:hypothetical protein